MILLTDIAILVASLAIILVSAHIFTNGIEHFGARLGLSEGVTGSIFAAIATALPEAIIPIIALVLAPGSHEDNAHIAAGAILGAPLMLTTLALAVTGIAAGTKFGGHHILKPEKTGFQRDSLFFLGGFLLAGCALYTPADWDGVRPLTGIALIAGYILYLLMTVSASARLVADGHGTTAPEPLLLARFGTGEGMPAIFLQLGLGLAMLCLGAFWFIDGVKAVSEIIQLPVLVLSLIIIPIATELPEKVNSVLWVRRRRDTLAIGNISGALVFQGLLLPAIGILMSPWLPDAFVTTSVIITILAGLWLVIISRFKTLRVWHFIPNGVLYLLYLGLALL